MTWAFVVGFVFVVAAGVVSFLAGLSLGAARQEAYACSFEEMKEALHTILEEREQGAVLMPNDTFIEAATALANASDAYFES